jgi:hypothetical protein
MEVETKSACCACRPAAAGRRETLNSVPTRVDVRSDASSDVGSTPTASTTFVESVTQSACGMSAYGTMRALDTRTTVPVAAQSASDVDLGVNVGAAVITLTAVDATGPGYLAAYRAGEEFNRGFSSLNFSAGQHGERQARADSVAERSRPSTLPASSPKRSSSPARSNPSLTSSNSTSKHGPATRRPGIRYQSRT